VVQGLPFFAFMKKFLGLKFEVLTAVLVKVHLFGA
jgi:hypothetical protein